MIVRQEKQIFKPVEITIETREELQIIRTAVKKFNPKAIVIGQKYHCDLRIETIEKVIGELDKVELD